MVAPPTSLESAFMTSKNDLRKVLRNNRQNFVLERNSSDFLTDAKHMSPLLSLITSATCVAFYQAAKGEPDLSRLANLTQRHDVKMALPWLPPAMDKVEARRAAILFRTWSPGDALNMTRLGFHQPADEAPALAPNLILTPLVGFDRSLNRLGQGAGHYDRAFQNWPDAIRVGVAWSVQEVDHLPVDPWDIPLDAIITEREWITGPHSRMDRVDLTS
jgi:5-formyltetrahydrofolate cyclo-ligase